MAGKDLDEPDSLPELLCPEDILRDGDWLEFIKEKLGANPYLPTICKLILVKVGRGVQMGIVMAHLRQAFSQHALVLNIESRVVLVKFKYYKGLEGTFRGEITHLHAAELGVKLQDANADLPIDELDKLYKDYMKDAAKFVSGYHSS